MYLLSEVNQNPKRCLSNRKHCIADMGYSRDEELVVTFKKYSGKSWMYQIK